MNPTLSFIAWVYKTKLSKSDCWKVKYCKGRDLMITPLLFSSSPAPVTLEACRKQRGKALRIAVHAWLMMQHHTWTKANTIMATHSRAFKEATTRLNTTRWGGRALPLVNWSNCCKAGGAVNTVVHFLRHSLVIDSLDSTGCCWICYSLRIIVLALAYIWKKKNCHLSTHQQWQKYSIWKSLVTLQWLSSHSALEDCILHYWCPASCDASCDTSCDQGNGWSSQCSVQK